MKARLRSGRRVMDRTFASILVGVEAAGCEHAHGALDCPGCVIHRRPAGFIGSARLPLERSDHPPGGASEALSVRILRNEARRHAPQQYRKRQMLRRIPLVAALVLAALVIPTTSAQAADSGLTPTRLPIQLRGPPPAARATTTGRRPIVLTNTTGSDVTLSAGIDTSPHPTTDGTGST